MTDIKSDKDRVQGMLGAADRWQKVSPKAVVSGSSAQAQNVLADAIHDIGCLWQSLSEAAAYIERLEAALEPFAKVGDIIAGPFGPALFRGEDDAFQSGCAWTENGERKTLTWGDFRRAREARNTLKGGNDGD